MIGVRVMASTARALARPTLRPRAVLRRPHVAWRAVAALGLVVAFVGISTGVASAHAQLLSTTPGEGGVLRTSPTSLSLTFSESVEISLGAIKVVDSNGHTVDSGTPHYLDGNGH